MIVVLSQGCAANFGDGEKIARILSKKSEVSFEFPETSVATPAQLEAFYLNVCTVKGNAGAIKLLRKAASTYPNVPIYITGCAPKDFREEAVKAVPRVQFTSLKELEASTLSSSTEAIKSRSHNVLCVSSYIGIVNIEEGCLDACAFCSTHLVKG
jgi:tRNA A37 methylthiotransferase MiaB